MISAALNAILNFWLTCGGGKAGDEALRDTLFRDCPHGLAVALAGRAQARVLRVLRGHGDGRCRATSHVDGIRQPNEAIKAALEADKGHPYAQELAAALILDQGGDVDQADWYVQQSSKRRETSFGLVQQARVMIRKGTYDEVERLVNKALKKEAYALEFIQQHQKNLTQH